MCAKLSKVLVTGGAGFIGSEFVRQAARGGIEAAVVDNLSYAGDLQRLKEVKGRYKFFKEDICSRPKMESVFKDIRPEAVVHFAAETHVDRSIKNSAPFVETNFKGTQVLLDVSRKYGVKKFIHISTDEVYGDILKGSFSESSPLHPNSPYAASKAAADLLINSYIRTYDFPAVIVRPSNNYGPWQYPEKLIPLAISRVLTGRKIPVYANGENVREWLYVKDCAEAVRLVLEKGRIGEIYNIGSSQEKQNIEVIKQMLKVLGKPQRLIKFVKDRPGHDFRYSLDSSKAVKQLGWQAKKEFGQGIKETINWYLKNRSWFIK